MEEIVNKPHRGELWIADLEPGYGKEMHKKRPVLIVSSEQVNKQTPHAIIIPASSKIPQALYPDMIFLPKQKKLDKDSVLLPVFIRSIDQNRLIKKIGTISSDKLAEVEDALRLILGIEVFD